MDLQPGRASGSRAGPAGGRPAARVRLRTGRALGWGYHSPGKPDCRADGVVPPERPPAETGSAQRLRAAWTLRETLGIDSRRTAPGELGRRRRPRSRDRSIRRYRSSSAPRTRHGGARRTDRSPVCARSSAGPPSISSATSTMPGWRSWACRRVPVQAAGTGRA